MDGKNLIFKIPKPKNFSFKQCYSFLDRGYDECLYHLENQSVIRAIRKENELLLVQVSNSGKNLEITCFHKNTNKSYQPFIYEYIKNWFDLDRDISGFYDCLRASPETKHFVQQFDGLRLMGINDLFEVLCWCVIGQQINLTFAHKIKTRLVHFCNNLIKHKGKRYYCFPTPDQILEINPSILADMQFSRQKISYIKNIATAFKENHINKDSLLKLDPKQQVSKLCEIKGVGPWTANYASMKSLGNMGCIAYGDTGLSSALHHHFKTEKKPSYETIDEIFTQFKGWESYFNFYLWRSLSEL